MIRYAFRDHTPFLAKGADAQVYGEALEAIAHKAGGVFPDPDDVWRAAKNPRHPLHPEYEWDQRKAAEAHWRQRSRQLIGAIYIAGEDNEPKRPAYFNIMAGNRRHYVPESAIVDDAMLRLELIRVAIRELRAFQRRFGRITFVAEPISKAIKNAEAHLAAADAATHREAAE